MSAQQPHLWHQGCGCGVQCGRWRWQRTCQSSAGYGSGMCYELAQRVSGSCSWETAVQMHVQLLKSQAQPPCPALQCTGPVPGRWLVTHTWQAAVLQSGCGLVAIAHLPKVSAKCQRHVSLRNRQSKDTCVTSDPAAEACPTCCMDSVLLLLRPDSSALSCQSTCRHGKA